MPVHALAVPPSELSCRFVRPEGAPAAGNCCLTSVMVSRLPGSWGGGYSRLLAKRMAWCAAPREAAGCWPGGRGRAAVLMLLPMAQRCEGALARWSSSCQSCKLTTRLQLPLLLAAPAPAAKRPPAAGLPRAAASALSLPLCLPTFGVGRLLIEDRLAPRL